MRCPRQGYCLLRLVLARSPGGLIGLERELKHRPAGLRTNLFICMGAAMYTLLSDALAVDTSEIILASRPRSFPASALSGPVPSCTTRNNLVTGLTTAATIFVVASVGMAVGGGLYLTAIFATVLILVCLFLLGNAEQRLNLKMSVHSYEVTGGSVDEIKAEVNRTLESVHAMMDNVQVAATRQHVRVQFELEGTNAGAEPSSACPEAICRA